MAISKTKASLSFLGIFFGALGVALLVGVLSFRDYLRHDPHNV